MRTDTPVVGMLSRLPHPFSSPWVWSNFRRFGLPVWFLLWSCRVPSLIQDGYLAMDATLYVRAARLWVAGGDPWSAAASVKGYAFHFAAPPINLLPLAPLGFLPESLGVAALMAVTVAAGVFVVGRLRLPWWWLLFPPMTEAFMSGNPSLVILALLISGDRVAGLASLLKIYAIVPLVLLGRWPAVRWSTFWMAVGMTATAPLWLVYLPRFVEISRRLMIESSGGFSAFSWPLPLPALVVAALLVLLFFDRATAAWLAVPVIWPATEVHYATLGMPVARGWLAWVLAVPVVGVAPCAVVALAAGRLVARARRRVSSEKLTSTP